MGEVGRRGMGGIGYNHISDLGVESAMSDFEAESFFLTLFQGHFQGQLPSLARSG